jgi:hypothetical protein
MATDIDMNWDAIEPERSKLRALVARVELEIAELRSQAPGAGQAAGLTSLVGAWGRVVTQLALGTEPPLRACPHCRRSILEAAVRCRYCMSRSPAAEPG